jgi:hypothetical protein
MSQGALIDVKGLQTVNRALKEVAPDLRREMFREIGSMVKARVSAAKDASPYRRRRPPSQVAKMHLRTGTFLTKVGSKKSIAAGGAGVKKGLFSFQAISAADHARILTYANNGGAIARGIEAKYGAAPRFLGREFLPSGQGGTTMWRQSRDIVERYIARLNDRIDYAANIGSG